MFSLPMRNSSNFLLFFFYRSKMHFQLLISIIEELGHKYDNGTVRFSFQSPYSLKNMYKKKKNNY